MGTLIISLLTLVLILISAFIVLIILMQRTSQSGGMGAALGGGAAESAFGSETNNILTKGTIYGTIAFFVVALGLYLMYQGQAANAVDVVDISTLISAGEAEGGAETVTAVVETVDSEAALDAVAEEVDAPISELNSQVSAAIETSVAAVVETVKSEGTLDAVVGSIDSTVSELESQATGAIEATAEATAAEVVPAAK